MSDLARRSSASAARSLFGGFVELLAGPGPRRCAGRDGAPALRRSRRRATCRSSVLVCVTTEARKAVGSTDGMRRTMARSPYARAWLEEAPRLHARLRDALLARDFARVGELAEASALAMHASAIAAGVVVLERRHARRARRRARAARRAARRRFATIDAGPHVKVLARADDAAHVRDAHAARRRACCASSRRDPGEGARLERGGVA